MAGRMRLAVVLLVCAAPARAAGTLDVVPAAVVGADVTLEVTVHNRGTAPVEDLRLEVVFQGRELRREFAGPLPPGAHHRWTVSAPLPAEPGTVPAVIRVHYADAAGRHAVPAVARVSTPAGILPGTDVRASLVLSPVTRLAHGTLSLDNPLDVPIHGRVVTLVPGGLSIEPESQAVDVAGGGRREVPLLLQRRGAEPGATLPVVVFFEYALEGHRHLAVAAGTTRVADANGAATPLAVGAAALLLAFGCLALAWRHAARRRASSS